MKLILFKALSVYKTEAFEIAYACFTAYREQGNPLLG